MDLHSIKDRVFQNSVTNYWNMLKQMSQNLKKNSVSKNMFIIVSILVVFILLNFWLIVTATIAFIIGKYQNTNNNKEQDGKK
jgi:hypothetical protein